MILRYIGTLFIETFVFKGMEMVVAPEPTSKKWDICL